MTFGFRYPDEHPAYFPPLPRHPQDHAAARGSGSDRFLLLWCLLVWPAVFASVVIATLLGAVIYLNAPAGGPLGVPFAWIMFAIMYALVVGLPLSLTARRRRWYIRLIPAVIVAAPAIWIISLAGVWAIPGTVAIALSIMLEATGRRHKWTT